MAPVHWNTDIVKAVDIACMYVIVSIVIFVNLLSPDCSVPYLWRQWRMETTDYQDHRTSSWSSVQLWSCWDPPIQGTAVPQIQQTRMTKIRRVPITTSLFSLLWTFLNPSCNFMYVVLKNVLFLLQVCMPILCLFNYFIQSDMKGEILITDRS